MCVTSGAGTIYLSGTNEYIACFSGGRYADILVFCVVFYRSLFAFLLIVLHIHRFTIFDYRFGIFKLFSIVGFIPAKRIHTGRK
jgi:hypothetical protein